jgi:hypothetical protein
MVAFSEANKIRFYAVLFLVVSHVILLFFLDLERQVKISISSALLFVTALFIALRGRALRRREREAALLKG